MTTSLFSRSVAVALLTPLLIPAILGLAPLLSGAQPDYSPVDFWRHQLLGIGFMAAPQLLLIAFGAMSLSAQARTWLSLLILWFTLATVSFQAWEAFGASILLGYWWLAYHVLALAVAVVFVCGVLVHRWIEGGQTSGDA